MTDSYVHLVGRCTDCMGRQWSPADSNTAADGQSRHIRHSHRTHPDKDHGTSDACRHGSKHSPSASGTRVGIARTDCRHIRANRCKLRLHFVRDKLRSFRTGSVRMGWCRLADRLMFFFVCASIEKRCFQTDWFKGIWRFVAQIPSGISWHGSCWMARSRYVFAVWVDFVCWRGLVVEFPFVVVSHFLFVLACVETGYGG